MTFSETVVGFGGGMLLGTVCAVLLWWSTFLYRVLDPVHRGAQRDAENRAGADLLHLAR